MTSSENGKSITEIKEEVGYFLTKLDEVKQEIEKAKAIKRDIVSLMSERVDVAKTVDDLKDEKAYLEKKISEKKKEINVLDKKIIDYQNQESEMQLTIDKYKECIALNQVAAKKKENELKELDLIAKNTEIALSDKKIALDKLNKQEEMVLKALVDLELRLKKGEERLKSVQKQVEKSCLEVEKAADTVRKFEKLSRETEANYNDLCQKNDELNKYLAEKELEKDALEKKQKDLEAREGDLSISRSLLEGKLLELKTIKEGLEKYWGKKISIIIPDSL